MHSTQPLCVVFLYLSTAKNAIKAEKARQVAEAHEREKARKLIKAAKEAEEKRVAHQMEVKHTRAAQASMRQGGQHGSGPG
jgi:hypothetical protein